MVEGVRRPGRRVVRAMSVALLALASITAVAAAERFPVRPIEVVIHSKYGGGTDTTARMMIVGAKRILGTDFTVVAKRAAVAPRRTSTRPASRVTAIPCWP